MFGLSKLIKEARRRRVFRTAGIYIVAAWVTVQVFSELFPGLGIPASAIRYIWLGAFIGFPIALVFGWRYDVTAAGIVRTAPADSGADVELELRKADYIILAALSLTVAAALYQLSGRVTAETVLTESASNSSEDVPSIGVLPFENLSGEPEQEYFVNGIHDALIGDLSRVSGLQVTSKTSVRAFANSNRPIESICDELLIDNIIEGGVSRSEDDVQVDVRLRRCSDDEPLWADSYRRRIEDVLIMQSEITRSIADAVQVALTREESEVLARARPVNPAAYESYLRGMVHLEMITPNDMRLAEEFFQRSLEFDTNSALAHWGLGRACRFQLQFGMGAPLDREPACRGHQFRALSLDPDLPQVHLGLALSYWLFDYDWDAADRAFREAIRLNPNYAEAYMFYSHFLAHLLRWEESESNILRAIELDPLNIFVLGLRGAQLHLVGRYDEAARQLTSLHEQVPGFGFGFDVLWYVQYRLGNFDASIEAAKGFFAITMGMTDMADELDRSYQSGGFEQAMLELGRVLESVAEQRYIQGTFVAMPFAMAGDSATAVEWLEKAFEQRDPMLPYVGTMGGAAGLAGDPGYSEILRKMNLSVAPSREGM